MSDDTGPKEVSLADFLPLWCTLREDDVTALVTPALDYVGAFEVALLDARHAGEGAIAGLGESLRSLLSAADDGWTLHFLYGVTTNAEADIHDYELGAQRADGQAMPPALHEYVAERVAWLRRQQLRKPRAFLFFSRQPGSTTRAPLGLRMQFAKLGAAAEARHRAALGDLRTQRNALKTRCEAVGLRVHELGVGEVRRVLFELLNPTHAARGWAPPAVDARQNLYDEDTIASVGPHVREYTEAEQLVFEDVVEERGHLRQEGTFRRAMTLKMLPEGGTSYLSSESLLSLVTQVGDDVQPFPYWLSVVVAVVDQSKTKLRLNAQHNLVGLLQQAVPFLRSSSVTRDADEAAKRAGIEGLVVEMANSTSKMVTLSLSVLLEGASLEQLDARTEVTRAAFSKAGNSELLLEEVTQLPAFLSMVPGAGNYQLRKKLCTSRNAADFLPLFASWAGCARANSLLWTPERDVFRFDFFDASLSAHHGLVFADTGSGKSVTLGALTLDALAAGHEAILVDNGRSWERLTRLMGGIHLNVDIRTALTPFLPAGLALTPSGEVDPEVVEDVCSFLELCVRDVDMPSFSKLVTRVVSHAVKQVYLSLSATPNERPLMHHFRDAVRAVGQARDVHPDDRAISENVTRRLSLFCGDEQYGAFLDRPSKLRFDAPLVCFEMEAVASQGTAKAIAFATVMRTITARAAAARKRGTTKRTLVEVDEGHTFLGQDETAERFLEHSYRVMRKYGVAMWMASQGLEDFRSGRAGRAIVSNSAHKFLLRHASGHDAVAEFFGLSSRARRAFASLGRKPGVYSDFLLLHGSRTAKLRLALHPLALWILTTSKGDKDFIAHALSKNPSLDEFTVLKHLAQQHPTGAPEAGVRNRKVA